MRTLLGRKSKHKMGEEQREARSMTSTPVVGFQRLDVHIPNERVFPGRMLRLDGESNGQTPSTRNSSVAEDKPAPFAPFPITSRSSARSVDTPRPTPIRSPALSSTMDEPRHVSERTQYIPASKAGPPRVLVPTSSSPDSVMYRRCEDEPIQIPGAIQSFGALLGLRYNDAGDQLEVRVASENCRKVLGYGPEQLFALNFLDILKEDFREEFIARVNFALQNLDAMQEESRLDYFRLTLTFDLEPDLALWCAIHLAKAPERTIICEFEEYSEEYFKDIDAARILPLSPVNLMGTDSGLQRNTTPGSTPVPAFQIARRRANQKFSSLDLFNALSQAEKQITSCKSLQNCFEVIIGLIAELTGYHRVMLYTFDRNMNGQVNAELLNEGASRDVFLGLRFPASDIPPQARDLYRINRIRLLHNRDATTARLVTRGEGGPPLDLTHSYLRAMSPIHNKYLENIGVRSTMSISIVINDELYGLIACHGYGNEGVRVALPIRELCRNIGNCASVMIQRLLMQQQINHRAQLLKSTTPHAPSFETSNAASFLRIVDADFAILSIGERTKAIGKVDPFGEAMAILAYLQSCQYTTLQSSHHIRGDFPGLNYPPGINTIAGLLLLPLNVGEGNDFIVFFRKASPIVNTWAGNPNKKIFKPGSEYLDPRTSFKRWTETIAGTCREWTPDQLDMARVMGMMYERFLDVWPQDGDSSSSIGNRRLGLIHAQAEKVKPSLSTIVNLLERALEYNTDGNLREVLVRTEKSSTALLHVIENLTKLTSGETGVEIAEEGFDIRSTASRVVRELQTEAQRRGVELETSLAVSSMKVKGGDTLFAETMKYFTRNSIKSAIKIRLGVSQTQSAENKTNIRITVQDVFTQLSDDELDEILRDFEEAQGVQSDQSSGAETDLSTIINYVMKVEGQIHVASEPGQGTLFSVELPFEYVAQSEAKPPRKLRNLLSLGPKGPLPRLPSASPNLRYAASDPRLNRIEKRYATESMHMDHAQSDQLMGNFTTANDYGSKSNMLSEEAADVLSLNILVAESNSKVLRFLDEELSQKGHMVDIASNGQEASEQFKADKTKIDVILMDVEMPIMDGILSTKIIRGIEKVRDLRIVDVRSPSPAPRRVLILAMSPALPEPTRFEYIQAGLDGWIAKPVDINRLNLILQGVKNPVARRNALYDPSWEGCDGGWFMT